MFERLPTHLEQQALLRIHRESLPRRNPEELRFEAIHLIQEPAKTCRDFAWRVRVGIVIGVNIPAIRPDFPDSTSPLAQQTPELLWIMGTRNSATDPDDCHGFVALPFDGVELTLQFFDCQQGTLQW